MAPTTQKAAVIQRDGSVALHEIAVPKPGPNEILVKVVAATQNPADWKTALMARRAGSVAGCDFSGIVEEIGSNVPPGLRSTGERVAGLVLGGIFPNGAFAEYLVTLADFVVHVPDTWSFEDAAQLGIAPLTALRMLHEMLELPEPRLPVPARHRAPPGPPDTTVLVSGGASSVGQYVVQFAKLSGLYVIATASERNFDLVRSFGADVVVDYRDPAGVIEHVADCVAEGTSFEIVAGALSGKGTIAYLTLADYPTAEGVKVLRSIVFDCFGMDYDFPLPFTASPELTALGRKWIQLLSELLVKADVRPNPALIQPYGLASVADGFHYMSEGKVSAQKITYRISDTPAEIL
ncbi:dehydrogenase [Russula earlei]|uniref:Dehydrogenase n=1 Tax=Russula earlei TaxID=71964 RepID=A0ACC0U545_9AGAM|nr:dehydrogenase [Russula earlei]